MGLVCCEGGGGDLQLLVLYREFDEIRGCSYGKWSVDSSVPLNI